MSDNKHYQVAMKIWQLVHGKNKDLDAWPPAQFNARSILYLRWKGVRYVVTVKKEE